MSLSEFDASVNEFVMVVRHREIPSGGLFEAVLAQADQLLGEFEGKDHLPKSVVRTLLDLTSLVLIHLVDSPDEAKLMDMYLEINELLMLRIP